LTRVFDTLWAVTRGAWTQNRENNPMQSRMGAGSQQSGRDLFALLGGRLARVTGDRFPKPYQWLRTPSTAAMMDTEH
jgi:hypothetical protein